VGEGKKMKCPWCKTGTINPETGLCIMCGRTPDIEKELQVEKEKEKAGEWKADRWPDLRPDIDMSFGPRKRCNGGKHWLARSYKNFYMVRGNRDGLSCYCKKCTRRKTQEWRERGW
jgi:hypothetical protein